MTVETLNDETQTKRKKRARRNYATEVQTLEGRINFALVALSYVDETAPEAGKAMVELAIKTLKGEK